MKKQNDAGVFQLENGNWGFRFKIQINGKTIDSGILLYNGYGVTPKDSHLAILKKEGEKEESHLTHTLDGNTGIRKGQPLSESPI